MLHVVHMRGQQIYFSSLSPCVSCFILFFCEFDCELGMSAASSTYRSEVLHWKLLSEVLDLPRLNNIYFGMWLKMKTSLTKRNPSQRFGKYAINTCGYWSWLDKVEVSKHAKKKIVKQLIDKYGVLAIEMESLKARFRLCYDCQTLRMRYIIEASESFLFRIVDNLSSHVLAIISKWLGYTRWPPLPYSQLANCNIMINENCYMKS